MSASRKAQHPRQAREGCFGQVPDEVLFDRGLPHGAVRLYAVLVRYTDHPGTNGTRTGEWSIDQEQLALDCGASTDSIGRWLRALKQRGHVIVSPAQGLRNRYQLPWVAMRPVNRPRPLRALQ